jgi:hypothetical protein
MMRSLIACTLLQVNNDAMEEDEMGRECSTNGEKKTAYTRLVGKPEGKNH